MTKVLQADYRERPYQRQDLADLVKIEAAAGEARWGPSELRFNARQIDRETRVVYLANSTDQQKPIGFYSVEFHASYLYICNLAVSEKWRRQGVAQFALKAIEAIATHLAYPKIALDVQENNLPAQLLYQKMGFLVVDIRRKHYRTQDGYHMIKTL